MAIIQGILGSLKNGVDNVVFTSWKGKNIAKRKPISYNDAKTTDQVRNRSNFKIMQLFLSAMLLGIRAGFKKQAIGVTQFNVATRENLAQVMAGDSIDASHFPLFKLSKGPLLSETFTNYLVNTTSGACEVDYTDSTNGVNAFATDKLFVAVYDVVKQKGACIEVPESRNSGTTHFTIPQIIGCTATNCVFYAFFVNPITHEVSDSVSHQM